MEAGIAEDDHLVFHLPDQGLEGVIGDVGRGAVPGHDQPELVQEQAQLAPDDPAMVGVPLAPDLRRTPSFTDGVDQLNAVGVDHAEERGLREEAGGPVAVSREQPKQAGPLRQAGKQLAPVAGEPPIIRAVAHALDGEQEGQGHDLAGKQRRLWVFGDVAHGVIDPTEQFYDKLLGGHEPPPAKISPSMLAAIS